METDFDHNYPDIEYNNAFGKILVTGASGYVGGVLVSKLVKQGYQVRIMSRTISSALKDQWPGVEIVQADALDYNHLLKALEGIDYTYYMIHSLQLKNNEFIKVDIQAADNFQRAAAKNHVKQIIYLGSLGDLGDNLSNHLHSRILVADELRKGKTPVTFLRAAVIIGSGSASYKIIHSLIKNCPFFILPSWANSLCQPISIEDMLHYLIACLGNTKTIGKTFDVGCDDILTYRDMLKIQASVLGKRRLYIQSPFNMLGLYSRIVNLFTSVKYQIIKYLLESCLNDAICQSNEIREIIPIKNLSYKEALVRTLNSQSDQKTIIQLKSKDLNSDISKFETIKIKPPSKSNGILSDFWNFMYHKPEKSTLISFNTDKERENFSFRILQRLGIGVSKYKILNVHKIGVNAPAKYIFEELLKWNGDSTCWPNHIAKVVQIENKLENLSIHLFGWRNLRLWPFSKINILKIPPLFNLNAINIQRLPDSQSDDNARFLLYSCSGGYPIGVFTMYVRSSIKEQDEKEQAQLFLMVGFNFYGKREWSKRRMINKIWELVHNRVTSNVLNRLKQLSEWRFEKIKHG